MEEKVLDSVYNKYAFLFQNKREYLTKVRQAIEKYENWALSSSNIELFLFELEVIMHKYLKERLNENPFAVLDKYIEINLKNCTNYLSALEDLARFCDTNYLILSTDLVKKLLLDNVILNNIVGNVCKKYLNSIKIGRFNNETTNKLVREFVYIYCDLEKIEIAYEIGSYSYLRYSLPPFDTKEQEIAAIKKAKDGDNAAKEEIVLRSVRLVYNIAKRYCSEVISMEDLIQEGIEGILYAINGYNFDYDIKFNSYAYEWIRQKISRYVISKEHYFGGAFTNAKLYSEYEKVYERLCSKLDREPTIKEVAEVLKVPSSKLYMVIISNTSNVSLDEPIDSDTPSSISEFLADDSIDFVLEHEDKEYLENIDNLLESMGLTKREKEVIKLRNGLDDLGITRTKVEVAEMLVLTHQRVAQLEKVGLEKIRSYMNSEEKNNKKRLKLEKKN